MDSKQIVKTNQFDEPTVALIKNTVAVGATDDELKLFLYQASRAQLDPLARQIYFVKRAGKVTIQTSIDGFRLVAERSGKYAGQDKPVFEEGNGKLISCAVTVYKFSETGTRYPAAVGVAYMDEYKPPAGQDFMWNKMPRAMLAKVAEALALRKAFPQDLSGLYTVEEMEQVDKSSDKTPEAPETVQTLKEATITPFQMTRILNAGKDAGMTNVETHKYIKEKLNPDWPDALKITVSQANKIADSLEKINSEDVDPESVKI